MNDALPEPLTCHVCGRVIPVDNDGRIIGHFGEHEDGWMICSHCALTEAKRPELPPPPPPKKRRRKKPATT